MPRTDDYITARKLSLEILSGKDPVAVAKRAGYILNRDNTIGMPFLDHSYRFCPCKGIVLDENGQEAPLPEQVLLLHYLASESDATPTGEWVAFREIPGASFYFSAFTKRAIDPLKKVFGANPPGFLSSAQKIGAKPIEAGDAGIELAVFPRVPLRMILYTGDDEFPPEAVICFDASAGSILSPEDLAWLASMPVYRMIGMLR